MCCLGDETEEESEDDQFCNAPPEVKEDEVLEFRLRVKCSKNPSAPKESTDQDALYINSKGNFFSLCKYTYCEYVSVFRECFIPIAFLLIPINNSTY